MAGAARFRVRAGRSLLRVGRNPWVSRLVRVETVRRRLRDLVKLIEVKRRTVVYSDFEDEIGPAEEIRVSGVPVGTDMDRFRASEREAQEAGRGLWGSRAPIAGKTTHPGAINARPGLYTSPSTASRTSIWLS